MVFVMYFNERYFKEQLREIVFSICLSNDEVFDVIEQDSSLKTLGDFCDKYADELNTIVCEYMTNVLKINGKV